MRLCVGHQHWQFWPILARFTDYYSLFWGPRVISTINKSWDAFTCRSSTLAVLADSGPFHGLHSQFWPILARFVDYYSLFWGPGVISMIDEPRGAITCRSSTLAVFVDSDPFRGLLLTVLGSQSDFHGC